MDDLLKDPGLQTQKNAIEALEEMRVLLKYCELYGVADKVRKPYCSLSLSFSVSLSHSVSLSLSLSLCLTLSFSISLFLYLCLTPSLSLYLSFILSLFLSLSHSHSISLSLSLKTSVLPPLPVHLSVCPSARLSVPQSVRLGLLSLCLSLSFCFV